MYEARIVCEHPIITSYALTLMNPLSDRVHSLCKHPNIVHIQSNKPIIGGRERKIERERERERERGKREIERDRERKREKERER